ncbi:hypothetical protein GLOIN_2v1638449 [Rhizophagus irregularis DAOM 181602=DAOM 197198]
MSYLPQDGKFSNYVTSNISHFANYYKFLFVFTSIYKIILFVNLSSTKSTKKIYVIYYYYVKLDVCILTHYLSLRLKYMFVILVSY